MKNRSPEIDFSFCAKRFTSFRQMIFGFSKGGKKILNPFVQRLFRSTYE